VNRSLLIDGGQTGCRVVYTEDGRQLGAGAADGLSPQKPNRGEGLLGAIGHALRAVRPQPCEVDVAVAGLTGFDGSRAAAEAAAGAIRSRVRAGRVVVTSDAVTSYLGAVGARPGAMVAAGTGIIGLAGDMSGRAVRTDGWGYILGDDGGGYYIGRRGLASALRAWDGRGGSEALRHRAEMSLGKAEQIRERVYGASNPVKEVASFAVQVAQAAREGDSTAEHIWSDAAREAALTATSALAALFEPQTSVTVSWAGGLFEARDLMLEPFKKRVSCTWPGSRLSPPEGDAVSGAGLLARSGSPPMFGSLVYTL